MRKRKVTAILTSDWHLRANTPKCRIDNYQVATWKKLNFIAELQATHSYCPILNAGDVFDRATGNPEMLFYKLLHSQLSKQNKPDKRNILSGYLLCIPGQHDLPGHSLLNYKKSALAVFSHVARVCVSTNPVIDEINNFIIYPFPYGTKLVDRETTKMPGVAILHSLVTNPKQPSIINVGTPTAKIFDTFKNMNLILCGDNHKPFVCTNGNQLLVSPGSLLRMDADQIEYQPRVYLWYVETNEVEAVYLPIEKDVIDRRYLDIKQSKDELIENYRSALLVLGKIGVSFIENMYQYLQKNNITKSVKKEILQIMEKGEEHARRD